MAQGKVHPGGTWDCAALPLYFLMAEISAVSVMSDKILLCFQLHRGQSCRGKSFNQSLLVIIWKGGTRFGLKLCEPPMGKLLALRFWWEMSTLEFLYKRESLCWGGNNHIHCINLRAEHFAHFLCVSVSEIAAKPTGSCQAWGRTPLL